MSHLPLWGWNLIFFPSWSALPFAEHVILEGSCFSIAIRFSCMSLSSNLREAFTRVFWARGTLYTSLLQRLQRIIIKHPSLGSSVQCKALVQNTMPHLKTSGIGSTVCSWYPTEWRTWNDRDWKRTWIKIDRRNQVHVTAIDFQLLSHDICNPMDCSPPHSSVHGILHTRVLEWVALSSSRGSSQPRDRTRISCISCIGRCVLYHRAIREAP